MEPQVSMIQAAGHQLETAWFGPSPERAPTLVLLHEGLGSVSTWKTWPRELAEAGPWGVFVYSRWGYGQSDAVTLPRPVRYMHDEALDALPEVLDAAGIQEAILVGHSDGGSIALIHAGSDRCHPGLRGVVTLAAHVLCEDISVASIESAQTEFREGGLRGRLARHHADPEGAFWGWNGAWLHPDFLAWNIEEYLPSIGCPALVIQGSDDEYGTLAQVDAIERGVAGDVSRLVLPGAGHAPQRDAPEATTQAIVEFARRALIG